MKTQLSTTSPSKRRYVADMQDAEMVKRIRQSEVELRDRNTVLRGIKPNVGCYSCCVCRLLNLCIRISLLCGRHLLKSLRNLRKLAKPGVSRRRQLHLQASDFLIYLCPCLYSCTTDSKMQPRKARKPRNYRSRRVLMHYLTQDITIQSSSSRHLLLL